MSSDQRLHPNPTLLHTLSFSSLLIPCGEVKAWLSPCLRNLALFLGLFSVEQGVMGQAGEEERLAGFILGEKKMGGKVMAELGVGRKAWSGTGGPSSRRPV